MDDTIKGNPSLFSSPVMNRKRDYFFRNLDKVPLDKLAKKCFKDKFSLKKTVRRAASKVVPKKVRKSIKSKLKKG